MLANFWIVAQQVGVLFALMGVGAVARRTRLLDENAIRGIVNLLILIVTPCLIVNCFQRPFDSAMLRGLVLSFGVAVVAHLAAIAFAYALVRHRSDATERVLRLSTVFSNAGFMGVPLEQAILGETGVFYGITYVAVFNLFIWSWGLAMMKGTHSGLNRMMFVNPGTVGLAFGLGFFLASYQLPEIVRAPIRMMADLNTPLAMVVIGFYLGGLRLGALVQAPVAVLSLVLRLVVLPLLVTALLYPFRHILDRTMLLASVIPTAAPVAAMATMFASKYKRDVNMSVGMVCGSTLLSIVTLPAVIALAMAVLK